MTTTKFHPTERQIGGFTYPAGWYARVFIHETGLIKTRGPFQTQEQAAEAYSPK